MTYWACEQVPLRNNLSAELAGSGEGVQRTAVRVLCPGSLTPPQRLHGKNFQRPAPRPTVPIWCPAGKVHRKSVSRMLQAGGGTCSWAWMVVLTVGMYGWSMTDSKAAIFTARPVTVPARCLGKKREKSEFPDDRAHRHFIPATKLTCQPRCL